MTIKPSDKTLQRLELAFHLMDADKRNSRLDLACVMAFAIHADDGNTGKS